LSNCRESYGSESGPRLTASLSYSESAAGIPKQMSTIEDIVRKLAEWQRSFQARNRRSTEAI